MYYITYVEHKGKPVTHYVLEAYNVPILVTCLFFYYVELKRSNYRFIVLCLKPDVGQLEKKLVKTMNLDAELLQLNEDCLGLTSYTLRL